MKIFMMTMVLVGMTASGAYAFGGKKEKGGNGEFRKILKQLDLSDEQKEKLKSMREESKDKSKPNKGEMKELHTKLQAAFTSNASDSELITLHTQIKELRMKHMDRKFNRMIGIRSVLNETQRKKFFELHQQMRKGKRGH